MRICIVVTNAGRDSHVPACLHYLGAANGAGRHQLDVYLVEPSNLAPVVVASVPAGLRLHRVSGPQLGRGFGKAALLNAGLASVEQGWECCALIDIDMLYGPLVLDTLERALAGGYVVMSGRGLDGAQSAAALATLPPFAELAALDCAPFISPSQIAFTPGWLARYREVFGNAQLFDERFVGSGYQDTVPDMAATLLARAGLAGKALIEDTWLHLDHPRVREPELRERNLALAYRLHERHRERLRAYMRRHGPPRPALPLLGRAGELLGAGRLAEAEATLREALTVDPDEREAAQMLTVALVKRGALDEALALLGRAVARDPGDAATRVNLGEALRRSGRLAEARAAFEQALRLDPFLPEARYNLGVIDRHEGDDAHAAAHFRQATRLRPGYTLAQYNLGNTLRDLGRAEQAALAYEAALREAPGYAEAHLNLGAVLTTLRREREAAEHYERAAALRPDLVAAHRNLFGLRERRGQLAQARAAGESALAIEPANDLLRLAVETLTPHVAASAAGIDVGRAELARTLAHWRERGLRFDMRTCVESGGAPPLPLIYQGRDERALREAHAALFAERFAGCAPPPRRPGPTRLGFVVTEGHEGVFLKCMAGLIRALPLGELQVGVACGRRAAAAVRRAIGRADLEVVILPPWVDRAAAALRDARFDVLVFWEIGTDNLNYLLPFCRCAPVQCATWGWPVTSGIPAVGYFLSAAPLEPQGAERHYSERLVKLPSLPTCYRRPPVPADPPARSRYGLRGDETIYLCAQNLRKVHPDFDALAAGVLRGDQQGRLIFLAERESALAQTLEQRLRAAMPDVAARISFLPHMPEGDYLGLVAASDVVLDTPHYGGGANTCFDAAAAATPVVTLPGAFHRGRWALAVAEALGVRDGVADTAKAYVARALALGRDRAYRAEVSRRIGAAAPALFDREEPARELADFVLSVAGAGSP